MKPRKWISAMAFAIALGASACAGDPTIDSQPPTQETTGTTEQSLIGDVGNIMIWPAGPIAWDGLVGTWPISVWSSGTIGAIAFDVAGVSNLGVSLLGFDGIAPFGITTPWLNAFVPTTAPLIGAAPFIGATGVIAPGFDGAFAPFVGDPFGFGFSASSPIFGGFAATMGFDGILTPGLGAFLTPALTSSAFMFTNLAMVNALTPFTFNVTFMAASAAQAAAFIPSSLSIFATPIGPAGLGAGAIPFTSMVFPVLTPFIGAGIGAGLGAGVVAPVGVAPLL